QGFPSTTVRDCHPMASLNAASAGRGPPLLQTGSPDLMTARLAATRGYIILCPRRRMQCMHGPPLVSLPANPRRVRTLHTLVRCQLPPWAAGIPFGSIHPSALVGNEA